MDEKKNILTYEGLKKYEDELEELKVHKRQEIAQKIKEARVEEEVDLKKIGIGCKVKILDMAYNEEIEYKIVGSSEANSLKGKISNESPVGKALLGAKKNDVVSVETQAGEFKYKVLKIERSKVS